MEREGRGTCVRTGESSRQSKEYVQRSWGGEGTINLQGLFQLCHLRVPEAPNSFCPWEVDGMLRPGRPPLLSVAPEGRRGMKEAGEGKFHFP